MPVFSEFDIWRKYDYSKNDFNKMNALTLYILLKTKLEIHFSIGLIFFCGKFLKNIC